MKFRHCLAFSLLGGLFVYVVVLASEAHMLTYGAPCPIDKFPMRLAKAVPYAYDTMVRKVWYCDKCGHTIIEYAENPCTPEFAENK